MVLKLQKPRHGRIHTVPMAACMPTFCPTGALTFAPATMVLANFFRLKSVRIFYAEDAQLYRELALPNIVEVSFSPRGTYISTWERPGEAPPSYQ